MCSMSGLSVQVFACDLVQCRVCSFRSRSEVACITENVNDAWMVKTEHQANSNK